MNIGAQQRSTRPPGGAPRPAWLNRLIALFLSRRFATFVVFGGLAALVNLGVGRTLYTMPRLAEVLPYWLAVGIGAACGLLVNFGLNYAFNFRYFGRSVASQLRTFTIVALGGVVLTAAIAQSLVSLAALARLDSITTGSIEIDVEFAAHVVATGLVTFYSFAAHSAFSFNVGIRRGLSQVLARSRETS